MKKALITGITGSGGSYLAEYLVQNHPEIEVYGISRWHSTTSQNNISNIQDKIKIFECDLTDFSSILNVLKKVKPDYIFHLASHANVRACFEIPLSVLYNNIMGTANLLESIKHVDIDPKILMCSTSEIYGQVNPEDVPIKETCQIRPVNPYAVSKTTQDLLAYTYFKNHNLKIIRTRMFAYLNPKRYDLFATSFARQVAKIELGLQKELLHGNLDSTRTIIDVRDAMEAYFFAIEKGKPGEVYNIGGNTIITVGEFLNVLKRLAKTNIPTRIDPNLLRPTDVTLQIPDITKFTNETGWKPKYSFEESVNYLLEYSRKVVKKENGLL